MKKITFIENGIYGELFYNPNVKDLSKRPVGLYLGGLPGSTGKNSGTYLFTELEWTIIHIQYYGSFDSSLDFSPENTFKTIQNIVEIIRKGEIRDIKREKTIAITNTISMVFAHSFGCYVTLKTLPFLTDTKLIVLISPLLGFGELYGSNEDPNAQIAYISRARPYTYRIKSVNNWRDHFNEDIKSKQRENRFSKCGKNKFLIIIGDHDKSFQLNTIKEIIDTDIKNIEGSTGDLLVIENGEHDMATLLNEEVKFKIKSTIHTLGL